MVKSLLCYTIVVYLHQKQTLKQTIMTNTEQIFSGITTSELIGYKVSGDNSKELRTELQRRMKIDSESRKGKVNNTELDAKYNG